MPHYCKQPFNNDIVKQRFDSQIYLNYCPLHHTGLTTFWSLRKPKLLNVQCGSLLLDSMWAISFNYFACEMWQQILSMKMLCAGSLSRCTIYIETTQFGFLLNWPRGHANHGLQLSRCSTYVVGDKSDFEDSELDSLDGPYRRQDTNTVAHGRLTMKELDSATL